MSKKVIDLSKWNTVKDYEKVAKSVDGVIIRCGYRKLRTGTLTEDPLFKQHITSLSKLGVPVGIYFFTAAINAAEGKAEADYAISLVESLGIKLAFPIAVDTEYSNNAHDGRSDNLSKADRTNAVVAFCERVIECGYIPMIYASDSWFKYRLNYDSVKKYKKWVADYSNKPTIATDNMVGWQKGKTTVNGIPNPVDDNIWYDTIVEEKKEETTIAPSNTTSTKKIVDGLVVKLSKVNLYSSSTATKVSSVKTGTYYIWSAVTRNKRVRITNKKENVKKTGAITGWINVSDIK